MGSWLGLGFGELGKDVVVSQRGDAVVESKENVHNVLVYRRQGVAPNSPVNHLLDVGVRFVRHNVSWVKPRNRASMPCYGGCGSIREIFTRLSAVVIIEFAQRDAHLSDQEPKLGIFSF